MHVPVRLNYIFKCCPSHIYFCSNIIEFCPNKKIDATLLKVPALSICFDPIMKIDPIKIIVATH